MERSQAKVISGLRGDQSKDGTPKANPVLRVKAKPGYTIFKARAASYRLQYTAPQVVTIDAETGRKIRSNPEAIVFRNYTYQTNDEKKIEWIMSRDAFGLGRDMWLLEDEQQVIVKDAVKGLLGQLQVIDPKLIPAELKSQLVQSLGADVRKDFTPPAAEQK